MTMQIEPVEIGGQHFVNVSMNGHAMKKRGPFSSADKAKAEADRIIREWTPALPTSASKDVVVLHGRAVELASDEGRRFVVDCTRAGEGLITDAVLQEMYEISPENWAQIDKNPTAEATERFVITINLGDDTEPFRREVEINPNKFKPIVDHEPIEKSDVE
jgi:hypothetical protein